MTPGSIACTLAAVLAVRFFAATLVFVKGRSMLPTLQNGSLLLMLRSRRPQRGQVVICHYPGRYRGKRRLLRENFVKRVIALPGETIEIAEGQVLIDGHILSEPYLDPVRCRLQRTMSPRTLGEDEYFVMGDNRSASNDSRRVGPIPRRLLMGRVTCVLWPLRSLRRL